MNLCYTILTKRMPHMENNATTEINKNLMYFNNILSSLDEMVNELSKGYKNTHKILKIINDKKFHSTASKKLESYTKEQKEFKESLLGLCKTAKAHYYQYQKNLGDSSAHRHSCNAFFAVLEFYRLANDMVASQSNALYKYHENENNKNETIYLKTSTKPLDGFNVPDDEINDNDKIISLFFENFTPLARRLSLNLSNFYEVTQHLLKREDIIEKYSNGGIPFSAHKLRIDTSDGLIEQTVANKHLGAQKELSEENYLARVREIINLNSSEIGTINDVRDSLLFCYEKYSRATELEK